MKTVFDVSHVLTQGIIEREVINDYEQMITVKAPDLDGGKKYLHQGEWATEFAVAEAIAEKVKIIKVINLKKQIERLEALKIKVVRLPL